jgi:hypothetical protein
MTDSELIDALGGPSVLAERLRMGLKGRQRVCNWRKRGIPARVLLDHPEVFSRARLAAPAAKTQETRDAA